MTNRQPYHHGDLRNALITRGIQALQTATLDSLSLRALATAAGVSKNAPYRHFRDRDHFLGALINEGFRMLYVRMSAAINNLRPERRQETRAMIATMGRAYMAFAIEHQELYRLMNSPAACSLEEEHSEWPRTALTFLSSTLSGNSDQMDVNHTAAVWAYIHGLVLLRIDGLFPGHLPEPDWERLAEAGDSVATPRLPSSGEGRRRF